MTKQPSGVSMRVSDEQARDWANRRELQYSWKAIAEESGTTISTVKRHVARVQRDRWVMGHVPPSPKPVTQWAVYVPPKRLMEACERAHSYHALPSLFDD